MTTPAELPTQTSANGIAGVPAEPNGAGPADDLADSQSDTVAPRMLGRVATPAGMEATSDEFSFWVPEGTPVERTQLVTATSTFAGSGTVTFYGSVDEVSRRSRRRDILEERDRYDGALDTVIDIESTGVTHARARVLASMPPLLTPPREESPVCLAGERDAHIAFGVGEMLQPLPFGLLKNGASGDAGPAYLDLGDLLGQNGAHVNVNGIPGGATKSSTLMTLLTTVLNYAHQNRRSAGLHVVPVVLNVKSTDLFFIDRPSRTYQRLEEHEAPVWKRIGINNPGPFKGSVFFAPQQRRNAAAEPVGRSAAPFSWGLRDLIEHGLFSYLFTGEQREESRDFAGLISSVERMLTRDVRDQDGMLRPSLNDGQPDNPTTIVKLLEWVQAQLRLAPPARDAHISPFHGNTLSMLARRLQAVVYGNSGVIRANEESGHPLDVLSTETVAPRVVDIQSIADAGLQRFVVGALLRQIADARTGPTAVPGLRYIIVLDELNRWAPKGGRDAVTRLIERVAAEMRSQGCILFGAQQQASLVSEKVIEAAAIHMIGRTGALEMDQAVWRGLPPVYRRMVSGLSRDEKVVLLPTARQPLFARMPCPAWAMRHEEALPEPSPAHVPGIVVEEE
jgi:hypothetical protein